MKKSSFILGILLLAGSVQSAPAPTYTTVDENFIHHHDVLMDRLALRANPETIKRVGDPAISQGTFFAWGGYNAAGAGAVSIDNSSGNSFEDPCTGIIFNAEANTAGSYAYTRFDTTTPAANFDTGAATPSVVVNASEPGSKLMVRFFSTAYDKPETQLLAVLIRDDSGWWVSSGKRVPRVDNTVGPSQSLDYEFHGPEAVTWTQVDMTTGGGADMDQVDNAGQAAMVLLSAGTPNFGAIEGMGLRVLEGPGDWFFGITEMVLVGASPTTEVSNWEER